MKYIFLKITELQYALSTTMKNEKMDRLKLNYREIYYVYTKQTKKNSAVILISEKGEFSAKKIARIEHRHFANKFSRKI